MQDIEKGCLEDGPLYETLEGAERPIYEEALSIVLSSRRAEVIVERVMYRKIKYFTKPNLY